MSITDTLLWSFKQNYYMDKANACVHCSPVRFSPITFRLYQALAGVWPQEETFTPEMDDVSQHIGKYEEDKGR